MYKNVYQQAQGFAKSMLKIQKTHPNTEMLQLTETTAETVSRGKHTTMHFLSQLRHSHSSFLFLDSSALLASVMHPWSCLSIGWASEAEDRGEQHEALCWKRPFGSLSEHGWTGVAGGTATDTDASGGKQPQTKCTLTDQFLPSNHGLLTKQCCRSQILVTPLIFLAVPQQQGGCKCQSFNRPFTPSTVRNICIQIPYNRIKGCLLFKKMQIYTKPWLIMQICSKF